MAKTASKISKVKNIVTSYEAELEHNEYIVLMNYSSKNGFVPESITATIYDKELYLANQAQLTNINNPNIAIPAGNIYGYTAGPLSGVSTIVKTGENVNTSNAKADIGLLTAILSEFALIEAEFNPAPIPVVEDVAVIVQP